MPCMRRPARDTGARVHIAAPAFLSLGVYGESTRRATCERVARLCLDTLLWPLLGLDAREVGDPGAPEVLRHAGDRHMRLLRLEGPGARARLAHILTPWGRPFAAVGALAPRLAA